MYMCGYNCLFYGFSIKIRSCYSLNVCCGVKFDLVFFVYLIIKCGFCMNKEVVVKKVF